MDKLKSPKVLEHQQGSTIYCTPAQIKKRIGECGYISALLDICDTQIADNEYKKTDDHFTKPIQNFWKAIEVYMNISTQRVLDILKHDIGMADWKYRLFTK